MSKVVAFIVVRMALYIWRSCLLFLLCIVSCRMSSCSFVVYLAYTHLLTLHNLSWVCWRIVIKRGDVVLDRPLLYLSLDTAIVSKYKCNLFVFMIFTCCANVHLNHTWSKNEHFTEIENLYFQLSFDRQRCPCSIRFAWECSDLSRVHVIAGQPTPLISSVLWTNGDIENSQPTTCCTCM